MANFDFSNPANSPRWTASDYTRTALANMPFIEMIEYQQTYSQLLESINRWARVTQDVFTNSTEKGTKEGGITNPYAGLYVADATGNTYKLPYFTADHHQINQNWQENQGPMGDKVAAFQQFVENVAKTLVPSAGIVRPKSWAGANEANYSFSFDLLNTINPGQDIEKNMNFIRTIIARNLHWQRNVLVVYPPSLYEIFIPGIRWSPVSVITGLTVTNKGTLNKSTVFGGSMIVPDAWGVTIQITELINESRNLFASIFGDTVTEGHIKSSIFDDSKETPPPLDASFLPAGSRAFLTTQR